ncbi:protein phosphatase 2C domain-containing protein [Nocardia takedensis]
MNIEHGAHTAADTAGDSGIPETVEVAELLPENNAEPTFDRGSWSPSTLPEIGAPGAIRHLVPRLSRKPRNTFRHSMAADSARVGTAWLAAASVRGPMHYEFRSVRQDAYSVADVDDERWIVVAVADGVSEGEMSHIAADLACRVATGQVTEQLADGRALAEVDWAAVTFAVRSAIRRKSSSAVRPGDFEGVDQAAIDLAIARQVMSTTLEVLVVAGAVTDDRREYCAATLAGDGSVLTLERDARWRVVSSGKSRTDGIMAGDVVALPQNPGPPSVRLGSLAAGELILVCTDGLGDELHDGDNELGTFLREAWRTPVHATEFLRCLEFVKHGAMDDRTAVVVWG